MSAAPYSFPAVADFVLQCLRQHPAGLGEYELLKALQTQNFVDFPAVSLTEKVPLFKMHFRLFHTLYQLRSHLATTQQGYLDIAPLTITLYPYQAGVVALTTYDPLQDYYADLNVLDNVTEADVDALLQQFWHLFYAAEHRQQALQTLGLPADADFATVKQRYRQLASQHHPDKGGDTAQLQAINAAMDVLTHCPT